MFKIIDLRGSHLFWKDDINYDTFYNFYSLHNNLFREEDGLAVLDIEFNHVDDGGITQTELCQGLYIDFENEIVSDGLSRLMWDKNGFSGDDNYYTVMDNLNGSESLMTNADFIDFVKTNATITGAIVAPYEISVYGLGNEDPSSVTFGVDEGFPTFFETKKDNFGNIFIKIPTLYRKINEVKDGQVTSFTIATAKTNNEYEPYPVFVKPNGEVMPYVLIGQFTNTSSTSIVSLEDNKASVASTLSSVREKAQQNGEGYQLYDWQFHKLIQDLFLIVGQKVDFQDGKSLVQEFLGIKRLTPQIWVDGVSKDDDVWRFCYDPSKYVSNATSSDDGYLEVGYRAPSEDGDVKALGYDASNPFFNYPSEVITGSNDKYYCDDYWYGDDLSNNIMNYMGYSKSMCGLWYTATVSSEDDENHARLCYRPLDETLEEFDPDKPIVPDTPDDVLTTPEVIEGTACVNGLGRKDVYSHLFSIAYDFPISFDEVSDDYGNVFIKIPTMYRKIEKINDGQITSFRMSINKIDDSYEPYPVFIKDDGTILEYVLIGKYCMSSKTIGDSTGKALEHLSINTARNIARDRGKGYQLYDWQFHKLFQDLVLVINQSVKYSGDDILGIKQLDSVSQWVDGISYSDKKMYIAYDSTKYTNNANDVEDDGYVSVGYYAPDASGFICKLGYDKNNSFFNYPSQIDTDSSYDEYYSSFYNYSSENVPIAANLNFGLWQVTTTSNWSTSTNNARLCYKPISSETLETIYGTASVTGLGKKENKGNAQTYTISNSFPTSFEEVTDESGNIFIKIPTMYRKIESISDKQINSFRMSIVKHDDTYEPYSVFVQPNGKVMDYVLIGKYINASSNNISSKASLIPESMTADEARNYARNIGNGYQLYDWQFHKLFQDLLLVTSQKVNFSYSGVTTEKLGIKDIDIKTLIDGVSVDENYWYFSTNPEKYITKPYSTSETYRVANYSVPVNNVGCISKIGYNEQHPFFNFPSEVITDSDYSSYYCDYYSKNLNNGTEIESVTACIGGGQKIDGIWNTNISFLTEDYYVRLCYRPVDEEETPGGGETPGEGETPEEEIPSKDYYDLNEFFTDVANAIRAKRLKKRNIDVQNMPEEILKIDIIGEVEFFDGEIIEENITEKDAKMLKEMNSLEKFTIEFEKEILLSNFSYSVNFKDKAGQLYKQILWNYNERELRFKKDNDFIVTVYNTSVFWLKEEYQTITFIDGTDIANVDLINYIKKYGKIIISSKNNIHEEEDLQYKSLESILNALAEAIRNKKETNEIVYGNKMPGKILTIKNKIDGYEIYDGTIEVK